MTFLFVTYVIQIIFSPHLHPDGFKFWPDHDFRQEESSHRQQHRGDGANGNTAGHPADP